MSFVSASRAQITGASGSIYDAEIRGGRGNTRHNPHWSQAAGREPGAWSVEAAIPYAALGLTRWRREIGFNIGRNGEGLGPRSWYPKYGSASRSVLVFPDAPEAGGVDAAASPSGIGPEVLQAGRGLSVRFGRQEARPAPRAPETRHMQPNPPRRVPAERAQPKTRQAKKQHGKAVKNANPRRGGSRRPAR